MQGGQSLDAAMKEEWSVSYNHFQRMKVSLRSLLI